jgi:hypothetical protein
MSKSLLGVKGTPGGSLSRATQPALAAPPANASPINRFATRLR